MKRGSALGARHGRRAWAVLSAFCAWFVVACVKAPLGAGTGRWLSLESEHFSLYTDLDREHAHLEIMQLERLFAGLQQSGWETTSGTLRLRLNVVMFDRPNDFDRYGRMQVLGFHLPSVLFEPWIVLPAVGSQERRRETLAHELTHYMAYAALPHQPRWFAEGLASYFQSGHFDDSGQFVIGEVPGDRADVLSALGGILPSRLKDEEADHDEARFYASSWLLVHYLMTERGEPFMGYQQGLAEGLTDEQAWQRAFPDLPPAALDRAVAAYAEEGRLRRFRMPIQEPRLSARERVLTQADEYALEAVLALNRIDGGSARDVRRAQAANAQALALDRQHLLANALDILDGVQAERPDALPAALRLCEAHPDHWLPKVLVGMAASNAGVAIEANSACDPGRATALAPHQPFAWLVRADQEALRGHRERAIQLAVAAGAMAPSNLALSVAQAGILARAGACAELEQVVKRLTPHARAMNVEGWSRIASSIGACQRRAISSGSLPTDH